MHFKIILLVISFVCLVSGRSAFATGDCNGDTTVTIDEVQSAINMFLGLKPSAFCVDEDHNGIVSIAEVQKTINSFLGLDVPGSYGAVYSGTFDGAVKPPYTSAWRMNVSKGGSISGHTDNSYSGGEFINGSTVSSGEFTVIVEGGYDPSNPNPLNGNITLTGTVDAVSGSVSGTWELQTNTSRKGTFKGTKETIPANRFTVKTNGTVYDSYHNLTWLKDANCFEAVNLVNNNTPTQVSTLKSGQCGLSDGSVAGKWRLPTRAEMVQLLDEGFTANTLMNPIGFSNVQSIQYYWASDVYGFDSNEEWSVNLLYGYVNPINFASYGYLWPVHTGQ